MHTDVTVLSRQGRKCRVGRKRESTEWEVAMGARLKEFRLAAELTQEALVRRADVSLSAYKEWEAGRRTPMLDSAIVRVADVLGVTLDELVGREPPRGRGKRGK
jgi:transcriptional regulator with XRE-family HTH domain